MVETAEFAAGKLAGAEIGRWTLRFRAPEVEREFDRLWLHQSLKLIRMWSAIGIAVFVAFGLLEWWIVPAKIGVSFTLRYGGVLPVMLAFYAATYTRWHMRTHAYNLVFCTFLTNLSYLYLLAITPFPQSTIYFFMLLLISLFTHGFVGVRFVHGLVASAITMIGYAAVVLAINPLPAKAAVVLLLVLFLAITVSVFSNYNQELHVRRDFRLNKLLAQQKQQSEELARQATQSSEAKSRFLAMMGHELRTPLNAIIGFAEIIANQLFGPVQPARYLDYATDINQSGRHLLSLINDILELSRAVEGKLMLAEDVVELDAVIEQCRRTLAPRAAETGVALEVVIAADVPPLRADQRKVRQIVLNLMSNAIKFTPAGGRVTVRADRAPDGVILFEVADTGIGIAPEDLATAMTPFAQIDSSLGRKYEGSGLGLPLTRAFAELHGGTLTLSSAPGQGTTATVRFPAACAMQRAAGAELAA